MVQMSQPMRILVDRRPTNLQVKEKGEKNVVFACWVEDKDGKHVLEGEGVLYPIPQKVKDKMAADGTLAPLLA